MSRNKTPLTIEVARDLLNYSPLTGEFHWAKSPSKYGSVRAGDRAGTDNGNGYLRIFVGGVLYHAHRLAWFHFYGEWPKEHIDHINGKRFDNRISNLRDVARSVNLQNRRKAQANNASGLIGAHTKNDRFTSSLLVEGKTFRLGAFTKAEDASAAYIEAKRIHHAGNTL